LVLLWVIVTALPALDQSNPQGLLTSV